MQVVLISKTVLDSESNLKEEVQKGHISKKDAADEIVTWLRSSEIAALGFMIAPLVSALFVIFDAKIGMILPLIAAAVGAFIYRKIVFEKKRLVEQYDLPKRGFFQ